MPGKATNKQNNQNKFKKEKMPTPDEEKNLGSIGWLLMSAYQLKYQGVLK